jgi:hypothetical protein
MPVSHLIIDSTKTSFAQMYIIEQILYGTLETDPRLPSVSELVDIFINPPEIFGITPIIETGLYPLFYNGFDLWGQVDEGIYKRLPESRLLETEPGIYILGS